MLLNVKWGVVSGVAAFVLAFITSLAVGHTHLLIALLRAAGFMLVFSGLGFGIWALINTFFPELLSLGAAENDAAANVFSGGSAAGSQVNITVDDSNAALPRFDQNVPESEQLGDFADLASGGTITLMKDVDQNKESGYTDEESFVPAFDNVQAGEGGGEDFMDFGAFDTGSPIAEIDEGAAGKTANSASLMDEDPDSLMDSFSFFPGDDNAGGGVAETSEPERKVSGNKAAKLDGDFNAKEIAQGLRTVLEKDKKG